MNKYLNYCDSRSVRIAEVLAGTQQWRHFVSIPCCGEDHLSLTLDSLTSAKRSGPLLLALVINENETTESSYRLSNRKCLEQLQKTYQLKECSRLAGLWLGGNQALTIVVCDQTGDRALPAKSGVGLARKMGADLGFILACRGQLNSSWLHSTDGDAQVDPDYFACLAGLSDRFTAAIIHPYRHIPDPLGQFPSQWQGVIYYESWLRYYCLGLHFANSKYQFPTIGSTITASVKHYGQVRGFPKRAAGEDFYLLNKLAKVGKVHCLAEAPTLLTTRPSNRVPFGTGQASADIAQTLINGGNYQVYHPQCFADLNQFLTATASCLKAEITDLSQALCPELVKLVDLTAVNKALSVALRTGGQRSTAQEQFSNYFDGLKSLQFIHSSRDSRWGSLAIDQAIEQLWSMIHQNSPLPSAISLEGRLDWLCSWHESTFV